MGFKNALIALFRSQFISVKSLRVSVFMILLFIFFFIFFSKPIFIFLAIISFVMFFIFLSFYIQNFHKQQKKPGEKEIKNSSQFSFYSLIPLIIGILLITFFQISNFSSLYNVILPKKGNYFLIVIGAIFTIILLIFIIVISRKRK